MDIVRQLRWRYATQKFNADKKVAQEKVEMLKEAFNLTATSFGLQPITMVIVTNTELKTALVPYAYYQEQVADCSHLLIFCINTNIDDAFILNYVEMVQKIRNTAEPDLIKHREALLKSFSGKSTDEITIWAIKQAYLAMGNLLTVCALENIDACPMEGFIPEKFDEVLQLRDSALQSVLLMPIGYRSADDKYAVLKKVRKNIIDAVIEL